MTTQNAHMHAALHALCQPLTTVSLALTLAQVSSTDAERALALEAAVGECQRAMESVRELRSLLHGGSRTELPGGGVPVRTRRNGQQCSGGAA